MDQKIYLGAAYYDTYYVRTQKWDKEYEYGMSEKQNIDGKRMRTSMYARRYVE